VRLRAASAIAGSPSAAPATRPRASRSSLTPDLLHFFLIASARRAPVPRPMPALGGRLDRRLLLVSEWAAVDPLRYVMLLRAASSIPNCLDLPDCVSDLRRADRENALPTSIRPTILIAQRCGKLCPLPSPPGVRERIRLVLACRSTMLARLQNHRPRLTGDELPRHRRFRNADHTDDESARDRRHVPPPTRLPTNHGREASATESAKRSQPWSLLRNLHDTHFPRP